MNQFIEPLLLFLIDQIDEKGVLCKQSIPYLILRRVVKDEYHKWIYMIIINKKL